MVVRKSTYCANHKGIATTSDATRKSRVGSVLCADSRKRPSNPPASFLSDCAVLLSTCDECSVCDVTDPRYIAPFVCGITRAKEVMYRKMAVRRGETRRPVLATLSALMRSACSDRAATRIAALHVAAQGHDCIAYHLQVIRRKAIATSADTPLRNSLVAG